MICFLNEIDTWCDTMLFEEIWILILQNTRTDRGSGDWTRPGAWAPRWLPEVAVAVAQGAEALRRAGGERWCGSLRCRAALTRPTSHPILSWKWGTKYGCFFPLLLKNPVIEVNFWAERYWSQKCIPDYNIRSDRLFGQFYLAKIVDLITWCRCGILTFFSMDMCEQ